MTAPAGPGPGAPGTTGTNTGQAPATGPQPNNTPPTEPAKPGPGAPEPKPTTDPGDKEPQDVGSLPEWAQKKLKALNEENAKHRTEKQTAAQAADEAKRQRAEVLRAFGLTEDGSEQPLTEDELQQRLGEQADATWAMGVENVLLRNRDVDAGELLDSRAFLNTLDDKGFADRDPREPGFADDLAAHVAEYVEKHPRFKAGPPPAARTGGDHPGGPGAPRTRPSLHAAIAKQIGGGGQ